MHIKRLCCTVAVTLWCFYIPVQAQFLDRTWQLSSPVAVAIPINQFAEATPNKDAFFGLGGELNAPIVKETPLRAGLSFTYFWLGSKQRNVTLSDSLGTLDINTRVKGSMMPVHAFVRFDLMNIYDYPILPYAGVCLGPRFFNVTTRTEIDYNDGLDPEIDYDRQVNVAVSYGFQVGVHIQLVQNLLLDIRWEHVYGGLATYLDTQTISIDQEGYASFQLQQTRTDMTLFSVGCVLLLGDY